jgi:predicted permease
MSALHSFLTRLRNVFRKNSIDRDMAEQIEHHLDLMTEENLTLGMSPTEARQAALRKFGGVEQIKEVARDQFGIRWLEDFVQDIRHGIRQLRKAPGFTTLAVLTLAIGIGTNAAVFNFVHSLLLAPLTYARPGEVMRVISQDRLNPRKTRDFSYPAYQEIRENNSLFTDVLASASLVVGVGEKGDTRRAPAAVVSANYFSVLGIVPAQGRPFLPAEAMPGSAIPVVIVSHTFWRKHHFDPALLGSTVTINSRPFTVIGILPESFTGTTALFFTEVWFPLGVYSQLMNSSDAGSTSLTDRTGTALMILGRLKPGLTAAAAEPALKALAANLATQFPVEQKDQVLTMAPLSRFASASNDTAVAWVGGLILGMAAIVLLVACLNLANMLLARGTARQKEIALRLALGGSRARIVRQLLTEGFLLALLGGTAGLLFAMWSSNLLVALIGRMIPVELVWMAGPQTAMLAATFGFCVVGTLVFALGPALKLSRGEVLAHLKGHAGEDGVRRRRKFLPRNPLVSAQIALSLALLTSAALFIRSAASAGTADTGLKADRVFLVEVDASLSGHNQKQTLALYHRLEEHFAALPEVESVSVSADMPLSGLDLEKQARRANGANDRKSLVSAKWNGVGEDYFKAAGLPLLQGRPFTATEATQVGGPPVVIINELLAKRLWPDGDALGERLQLTNDGAATNSVVRTATRDQPDNTFEVVGIVPTTRHALFESRPDPAFYLPFVRGFQSHVFFHVKFVALSHDNEAAMAELLRRAVSETDASLPVLSLETFAQHLHDNIQIWVVRSGAALFSAFGGLALCLAVVGAYGVIAYSVARRTREIGIRMALGARPNAVQRMILWEIAVMLATGLTIGLLLSLGIGKVMSSLLYRVDALDPVAFTVAPVALAIAAILACWLPARRATKVDPMVALRAE